MSEPYRFKVRFHDVDAAGVMFFAYLFRHAHDAYEAWLAERKLPLHQLMTDLGWRLPLVRAEADYHAPLRLGAEVTVTLVVAEVKQRSFTLSYRFEVGTETMATARTTHVFVPVGAQGAAELPDALRQLLQMTG